MTDTAQPIAVPQRSLVELIDRTATPQGLLVMFAASDLAAIREAALKLEEQANGAANDLKVQAEDYLAVHTQLEETQRLFDAESAEADMYAKRMHDAWSVIAVLWNTLTIVGVTLSTEDAAKIEPIVMQALDAAKAAKAKRTRTVVTEETAPLGELQA